ncbi:hypothetical protein DDE74_38100 [Streptomyces lydicus]|uniref:Tyrosinase n=1 Tax=Streptomyces lydicus TaxID=47763 RepID=A0A3S9YLP5_9ACTN|nr:hypothetical protein DDE74_38100 [Streptomyces lydicus]
MKFLTRLISGAVAGLALTAGTVGLAGPAAAAETAPPCVRGTVDGGYRGKRGEHLPRDELETLRRIRQEHRSATVPYHY